MRERVVPTRGHHFLADGHGDRAQLRFLTDLGQHDE
jgi:hypothetical protein